jgi:hypothetical protein
MEVCAEIPYFSCTERYLVDVAGESFYEDSFSALCGDRTIEGVKIVTRAHLYLEDENPYDKCAVKVTINGYPVGYLSRADARAFRRLVRYGELSLHETFECAALICGGWDRGDGKQGNYGVRLDLQLEE